MSGSQTPRYVQRIARLPRVFERLAAHPDGLPLAGLAAELDVEASELREDLLAFYTADVGSDWLLGLTRPDVVEFLGPEGDAADPTSAEVVRMVTEKPLSELGVEHVDASELALIYTAANAILDIEPDDADLAGAVAVLEETVFGRAGETGAEPDSGPRAADRNRQLQPLQEAQRLRRAARITYSRAWEQGVTSRVIHPYRLVQTRRGWEVDAGPLDGGGDLRTFLLSNIRDVEVLEETFELPGDLAARLEARRATQTVRVCLPHSGRWAADMYAERAAVVQDDEESVVLDVELLPPLERRVGMLLLAAGPDAFVVEPAHLDTAGAAVAEELLAHHAAGSDV